MIETSYDGIIPTGWMTAYGRSFSDILYARELFETFDRIGTTAASADKMLEMRETRLAPQFEARHKLLSNLILSTDIHQVIDVAAGLTTRGLEFTDDPDCTYVEVDLPTMTKDKQSIIDQMVTDGKVTPRPNLRIAAGNAVELDDLLQAVSHFDTTQPIVVTNEGLLRYLSREDKATFAYNVSVLLEKFGGAWITSDISLPKVKNVEDSVMKDRREWISRVTGRDVTKNLFDGPEEAKSFFENLGFCVESHSFMEVADTLTSPARLDISQSVAEELISSAVVFVMRLRH